MQQTWVFNFLPPLKKLKRKLLDADSKKRVESSCLLFVAQSGYARCVFRLSRPVVSVIPLKKWIAKAWNKFMNPPLIIHTWK